MEDLQFKKSVILGKLNNIMKEIAADGYKDVKTLNLILLVIANCCGSGVEFTDKVKRETCVVEVLRDLAKQRVEFNQPILLLTITQNIRFLLLS